MGLLQHGGADYQEHPCFKNEDAKKFQLGKDLSIYSCHAFLLDVLCTYSLLWIYVHPFGVLCFFLQKSLFVSAAGSSSHPSGCSPHPRIGPKHLAPPLPPMLLCCCAEEPTELEMPAPQKLWDDHVVPQEALMVCSCFVFLKWICLILFVCFFAFGGYLWCQCLVWSPVFHSCFIVVSNF